MPLAETKSSDRLSLELPPDAAHILTARLFAGGVARSLELGQETADVLRLMLTEICSEAIERRHAGRILIEVLADAGTVRVTVVATGDLGEQDHSTSTQATFRRTLIEALAPEATFVEEPDRLTVTFTL